jgi:hypothetical protein
LLLAALPFVVALSSAFEVDLALALCDSSDFALDFLAAALDDVEDACTATVLANHPLSLVASGPSAPNRLGVRASVRCCCSCFQDRQRCHTTDG